MPSVMEPLPTEDSFEGSDEAEDLSKYSTGGFYPVALQERFNKGAYKVVRKLGFGSFSTVWLARKEGSADEPPQFVALKVLKADPVYYEDATRELSFFRRMAREADSDQWRLFLAATGSSLGLPPSFGSGCVRLFDAFDHFGPRGKHFCSAFEVLGPSLLHLVDSHRARKTRIPLPLIRTITAQLLTALVFVHDHCGLIHTDLKLENVAFTISSAQVAHLLEFPQKKPASMRYLRLLSSKKKPKKASPAEQDPSVSPKTPDQPLQPASDFRLDWHNLRFDFRAEPLTVRLLDFGNAEEQREGLFASIQTCEYRCPETILRARIGPKADIWSLACVVFELITGEYLFRPKNHTDRNVSEEEDQLAFFEATLGPFPKPFALSGQKSDHFFTKAGKLRAARAVSLRASSIADSLVEDFSFSKEDAQAIEAFLLPMLAFDPEKRASAKQMLMHPWLLPAPAGALPLQ